MESLVKPVRESKTLTRLQKKGCPATLWGVTRCAEPLVMEALRNDSLFSLIVTYDRARADKLFQDYRFVDRDVYLYPAKDALFYYADVHGNLTSAKRLEIIKRIYRN
jgi:transcription-repair coupling factor (superfamily II helicase)